MGRFIDEEGDAEMKRLRKVCPGFAEMEWIDEEDQRDASDSQDVLEQSQGSEKPGQYLDENNASPDAKDTDTT